MNKEASSSDFQAPGIGLIDLLVVEGAGSDWLVDKIYLAPMSLL